MVNTSQRIFGEKLREEREAQGFSREELAERLGVSATTVYRWETAARAPRPPDIDKMCEVLGRTREHFFSSSEESGSRLPSFRIALQALHSAVEQAEMTERLRAELSEARARIVELEGVQPKKRARGSSKVSVDWASERDSAKESTGSIDP